MLVKGIIFDFDGTLLDSMVIWDNLGEKYLNTLGIKAEEDLHSHLKTMSLEEAARFLKYSYHLADNVEEIMAGITALIEHFYRYEAQLKLGAKEILEYFSSQNWTLIIATATERELVEAALKRCQIGKYFTAILTCSEVGAGKTKPDIFIEASRVIGALPGEILVFEDALYALRTAKQAGFTTVAVYDTSEPDQEQMRQLSEIYLEKLSDFIFEK